MRKFCLQSYAVLLFAATSALAQAPDQIAYQGLLYDAGIAVDNSNATLIFSIYSVETDGTELWTETQTGISITDGQFFVYLGSVSTLANLAFDVPYWLEVTYEGTALLPRLELVSVPYSRTSAVADSVPWSGITGMPSGFADGEDDKGDLNYLGCNLVEIPFYIENSSAITNEVWITVFGDLKQGIYEGDTETFADYLETSTEVLGNTTGLSVTVRLSAEASEDYTKMADRVIGTIGPGITNITDLIKDELLANYNPSGTLRVEIALVFDTNPLEENVYTAYPFLRVTAGYFHSSFGWSSYEKTGC